MSSSIRQIDIPRLFSEGLEEDARAKTRMGRGTERLRHCMARLARGIPAMPRRTRLVGTCASMSLPAVRPRGTRTPG